ncbi:bifunctional riboflavin kinase/FAD synthetase [Ornithinibacillus sp. L9]|uniref:Riboflavin biosynthesis protein n=1 Tax=Ornithinibacillus caprae TaxID=2678566 RepID=A0A6N8FPS0_9BACI|nr:bifunctional riboflavin kinase/FAD synthetase [Ornithinibacillus caprae]MUK89869.1 bifunctional riboflavin kinase/FAD synthetase [Ornithinibacillus caprae]
MRTIELTYPHTLSIEDLPETVSAIGFFDGIHKGHQRVIQTAVEEAKQSGMESAVITFHPHPSVVLNKEKKHVKYITPMREKKEVLTRMNVDRLYIITFNKELSSLSPEDFIDHFIIGLNIKHLVAGFDFSYGHKGKGNMNVIGDHAKGLFTYTTVDKVINEGEKISSTRIRKLLDQGNVEKVQELLGRPLSISGKVIEGAKRGREIGFPTANIEINSDVLLPKPGIYAVKVIYKNTPYEGMASLGINPTFTADRVDLSLEVNIFDYNNDIYGEELQLQWFKFIRDEEKFDSVEELIDQIHHDEKVIRTYFS